MGYVPENEQPEEILPYRSKGHGHKPKKRESRPLPKRKGEDEWGDDWDDHEID